MLLQFCYSSFYFLQVIAPPELAMQTRLSMNMSQLQSLDSESFGSHGQVGDPIIFELQKRVFSLREALELPPRNVSANLDEVYRCYTVSNNINCNLLLHILELEFVAVVEF